MKETPKATQANKISAVKSKGDDPKCEQQQAPQGNSSKKKWKRGKCAGKKQKEKESKDSSSHAHAHITSVVYTSGPEPPMDPHALTHCPTLMYQGEQGPPFHIGSRTPSLLPTGLSSWSPAKKSAGSILDFRSRGLGSYLPLSTSHCPPFHHCRALCPHCSHLYMTPLLLSTIYVFVASSTVTLDSPPLSLTARLEPIYKSDKDSPSLAKHSKCACHSQIMALPTDYWDEEDPVNIYGLGVENDDDGFVCMWLYILHSLFPHDSLIAALAPTASSYINICGSIHPCNENH